MILLYILVLEMSVANYLRSMLIREVISGNYLWLSKKKGLYTFEVVIISCISSFMGKEMACVCVCVWRWCTHRNTHINEK